MKYLLTIYDDESMWSDAQPGDVNQMMDGYRKFGEEVHGNGAFVAGEALESISTATTVRVKDGERARHRRPVRGDEGAARRLLPARLQGPRRGDRVRGEDPGSAERMHRGAAGQGLRERAPGAAIDRLFRRESGRAVASLIRVLGDFDLAEEAVQEASIVALERWPRDGVPAQPGRVDHDDRAQPRDRPPAAGAACWRRSARSSPRSRRWAARRTSPTAFPDDRLRLMFTCCHPALARGGAGRAHAAHARRALGAGGRARVPGRRADDGEAAGARASARSPSPGSPTACPRSASCRDRMPSVLAAVYLIFNEGYAATAGEALVRRELCAEAIRLGRLLAELMPGRPEPRGLLALMLLHHARRDARVDGEGRLVLLSDQDRSLWHADEIEEGRGACRARRRPTATGCRRRSPPSTSRTRPTGRTWRRCTRGSPRSTRAR